MYSSCFGTRPARISATPYIPTPKAAAAARNQSTPPVEAWKWMPRAAAAAISTAICKPVIADATIRFPSTSSGRGTGAASSSRCAPCSRSTITLSPENIMLSGISSPTVPIATNAS